MIIIRYIRLELLIAATILGSTLSYPVRKTLTYMCSCFVSRTNADRERIFPRCPSPTETHSQAVNQSSRAWNQRNASASAVIERSRFTIPSSSALLNHIWEMTRTIVQIITISILFRFVFRIPMGLSSHIINSRPHFLGNCTIIEIRSEIEKPVIIIIIILFLKELLEIQEIQCAPL